HNWDMFMNKSIQHDARHERHSFDFHFPSLHTWVRLQSSSRGVVIRATRNSFSERRKVSFIRELGAEGFIDDRYQGFSGSGSDLPVCWLIDCSWLVPGEAAIAQLNRFMIGSIASGALLWFTLMGALFICSR